MTTKAALLAHLRELHTGNLKGAWRGHRITDRSTFAQLSRAHQEIHHRLYCNHYHAGPNPGPWLRPPGWKTGEDAILRTTTKGPSR